MPGDRKGQRTIRLSGLAAGVVFIAVLMLSGALTEANPVLAQTDNATATITAPDVVTPGSDFTATVNIGQVQDFDAANFDISFNPAVLRLDDITGGNIGGVTIPVEAWNQREPGRFTVVLNIPGLAGASGSGYLAGLRFHITGSTGQSSNIVISDGVISNTLAHAVPLTWTGVLVQVMSTPSGGQGTPSPASFSVSGLSITPSEVIASESVEISVLVTNSGGTEGSYTVFLKVNGSKEAEKEIVLGARQNRIVSFTVIRSTAGLYTVDVNGEPGEFTVITSSTPPGEPEATPNESGPGLELVLPPPVGPGASDESFPSASISPTTPTAPSSLPSAPAPPPPSSAAQPEPTNWSLLGGGIGGVAVVIGLAVFLLARRRSY